MSLLRWSLVSACALLAESRAGGADLAGAWDAPEGLIEIRKTADGYSGTLRSATGPCAGISPGSEVLRGQILDDAFTGELRLCLEGAACVADESWLSALLVVDGGGERMSGAVEMGGIACHPRVGAKGGLSLRRHQAHPAPIQKHSREEIARARGMLADGKAFLEEGGFEQARARFQQSLQVVRLPEAYNGIGVCDYARGMYQGAERAYKEAVQLDPSFGDAYYNLGCLYAVQQKKDLAFRYLKLSVRNGYKDLEQMDHDDDLKTLRSDARYQALRASAPGRPAHN